MKNKHRNEINEINNIEEILKGKYKELQDILDSDLDKDIIYIDRLNEEIEDMEKEIKELSKYPKCENNDEILNSSFKNKKEKYNVNEKDENYNNIQLEKELDILEIGNNKYHSLNVKTSNLYCKNDIERMENQINEYIEFIKNNLDVLLKKNDINLYNHINLKTTLNKISSRILLFKNNYTDYIKNFG